MNLDEKIAKARAVVEDAEPTEVPVELGGEITTLTFLPAWGEQWSDVTAMHPPRPGATLDANLGYNSDAASADYPVDKITVDGESVTAEKWREICSVLTEPNRKIIASVLWGLNRVEPNERIRAAGKAKTG